MLPDSGMDTKIATLRGHLQSLENEFRYASRAKGERIGAMELKIEAIERNLNAITTELKVTTARLSLMGGLAAIVLTMAQIWVAAHR
jgi:hypothetical protein